MFGPRSFEDVFIGADADQPVSLDGQGLADRELAIDRDDLAMMEDQVGVFGRRGGTGRPSDASITGRHKQARFLIEPRGRAVASLPFDRIIALLQQRFYDGRSPGHQMDSRRSDPRPRGRSVNSRGTFRLASPVQPYRNLQPIRKQANATDDLSLSEARRLALAAQGFDRPRPSGRVDARDLGARSGSSASCRSTTSTCSCPPTTRCRFRGSGRTRSRSSTTWSTAGASSPSSGPTRRRSCRSRPGRCCGTAWNRTGCARGASSRSWNKTPNTSPGFSDEVRARGPLAADDMPEREGIPRRIPGAWHSSVPRAVLEAHFGRGMLAVAERRPDFVRTFDLTERLIPPEHHGRQIGREEAQRELLRLAARAHGVGTADDLADYYRMPVRDARPRLAELVEAGELRLVQVEGWRQPAYLHREARLPKQIDAATLLSPFDPVIWYRARAARLFDFEYRVEIFVPKPKRRWGYYVLPFLLGDRLVARVDLKADRKERRLLVLAAHLEPHPSPARSRTPLPPSSGRWRVGWASNPSSSNAAVISPGPSPPPSVRGRRPVLVERPLGLLWGMVSTSMMSPITSKFITPAWYQPATNPTWHDAQAWWTGQPRWFVACSTARPHDATPPGSRINVVLIQAVPCLPWNASSPKVHHGIQASSGCSLLSFHVQIGGAPLRCPAARYGTRDRSSAANHEQPFVGRPGQRAEDWPTSSTSGSTANQPKGGTPPAKRRQFQSLLKWSKRSP